MSLRPPHFETQHIASQTAASMQFEYNPAGATTLYCEVWCDTAGLVIELHSRALGSTATPPDTAALNPAVTHTVTAAEAAAGFKEIYYTGALMAPVWKLSSNTGNVTNVILGEVA